MCVRSPPKKQLLRPQRPMSCGAKCQGDAALGGGQGTALKRAGWGDRVFEKLGVWGRWLGVGMVGCWACSSFPRPPPSVFRPVPPLQYQRASSCQLGNVVPFLHCKEWGLCRCGLRMYVSVAWPSVDCTRLLCATHCGCSPFLSSKSNLPVASI